MDSMTIWPEIWAVLAFVFIGVIVLTAASITVFIGFAVVGSWLRRRR